VKQGDLLAEIDPRPYQVQLDLAEAQKARDEALLANARVDLARYKTLMDQDALPKQQLDTQISTVAQYEATVKADQATIDNARLQLVYSRITSPLTGRIGLRLVDRGNIVHATDTNGLAVVTELQPIAVIFNIAEDSLPQVAAKMRAGAKLPIVAYDRDLKKKLADGTLLTIDNQIDQTSGTVRFKGQFENADLSLFPNQFVNARLLVKTLVNATLIPTAAVQHNGTAAFVYTVNTANSTVAVQSINVVTNNDTQTAVTGINSGVNIATSGFDRLENGAKVTIAKPGTKGKSGGTGTGGPGSSGSSTSSSGGSTAP
jgi:multidrug efflux system membrane fusion protein